MPADSPRSALWGATGLRSAAATVLLTALAATLSLGGHVLGGGQAPGLAVSLALMVPTWWLARPLTRRRMRGSMLVAWLGAMQLMWHGALAWSEACAADPAPAGVSGRMLVAHLVAAAGLAVVVRRLERWFEALMWAWRALERALTPSLSAYAALPDLAPSLAVTAPQISCPSDRPAQAVPRRGPPA